MNADATRMMDDLMPQAYVANNDALDGLARLDALAKAGDEDAIRMFHAITCGMVERINELHLDYAASVLEWPVLLPQDPKKREGVTKQANAMRIGSTRGCGSGAGRGRLDELAYTSQKGFAIENLRRVDFARALLRPIPPSYKYDDSDAVAPIPATVKAVLDDPSAFQDATKIMNFGEQLLLEISMLPDYSLETRDEWIRVMVWMLRRNRNLVPDQFRDSQRKDESYTVGNAEFTDTEWRGGILARTLRDGLEATGVSVVPGFWGQ